MSLTSSPTSDSLSPPRISPLSSRESNSGQPHLRRRAHTPGLSPSSAGNGSVTPRGGPKLTGNGASPIYGLTEPEECRVDEFESFSASEVESESSPARGIGASTRLAQPNGDNGSPKKGPRISTAHTYASDLPETTSPNSRSWYEFDLSVVVALVSPIGNWLTGGDHVKNLLLILLLIFYLHQIIEVPWSLYHKSRPRRRLQHFDSPDDPASKHAASELRTLELVFLILTVTSPFLGAVFLNYVITLVSGRDALSWFSTALFVLATGIRPWRHLVERLNDRAKALHDVIHYPPAPGVFESKIDEMLERITRVEAALANMHSKFANTTDELYDYVDDSVDSVEMACRGHDKRFEKQDTRIKDIEEAIMALKKSKDLGKKLSVKTYPGSRPSMAILSLLPSWLGFGLPSPPSTPSRIRHHSPSAAPSSKHGMRTYPSNRLESIPEEDIKPVSPPSSSFQLRIPGAPLVLRWGDLATLPLRRVVHYLLP